MWLLLGRSGLHSVARGTAPNRLKPQPVRWKWVNLPASRSTHRFWVMRVGGACCQLNVGESPRKHPNEKPQWA